MNYLEYIHSINEAETRQGNDEHIAYALFNKSEASSDFLDTYADDIVQLDMESSDSILVYIPDDKTTRESISNAIKKNPHLVKRILDKDGATKVITTEADYLHNVFINIDEGDYIKNISKTSTVCDRLTHVLKQVNSMILPSTTQKYVSKIVEQIAKTFKSTTIGSMSANKPKTQEEYFRLFVCLNDISPVILELTGGRGLNNVFIKTLNSFTYNDSVKKMSSTQHVTAYIISEVNKFKTKAHKSMEEIEADSMVLLAKISVCKDSIDSPDLINEWTNDIINTKQALAQKLKEQEESKKQKQDEKNPQQDGQTSPIPIAPGEEGKVNPESGGRNIKKYIDQTKEKIHYDKRIKLKLGEVVTISNKDMGAVKDKASWVAKFSKAWHDAMGYEPQGDALKVLSKYQAVRDLHGSIISSTLKKIGMGRTGDWARTEMLQKPGEVNPRIVELEQRIRNLGTTKKLTVHDKQTGDYAKKTDIDTEKKKKETKLTIRENAMFTPPIQQSSGSGNPVAPARDGTLGSGDKFPVIGNENNKEKEDKNYNKQFVKKVMSFSEFK